MNFRNKKANGGLYSILTLLLLGLVWLVGLTEWISKVGQQQIVNNNLTGLNAFFYANMNLWFGIAFVVGIYALSRFTI